ncbi:MAG: Regulatory protein RecX [Cytophagales bacterium]|jgi:regulatory protein|nr:RecX family transcriptional regulator [Bacteroidota bacterium]MBS1979764.1 RecX family transcriptional regulator [Bacteroidota bacterium]WHZ07019.1 MAG: Regulatory protein RecX [Cytophagales bacterium]
MKKNNKSKTTSSSNPQIKNFSNQEALSKIYRYCAYQERSHREVKNKLFEYGLYASEVDALLSRLITEGFLNEERFAKAFAGGKFRLMKWGKLKIEKELEMRGLTPRCIARGMTEIDHSDYSKTLRELLVKKSKAVSESNPFQKKNKIARYAISKGYEPELVWEMIREVFD